MAKETYTYPYSDEKGNYTFRTIGGRKVKIYENQSLADAMIESGKFKTNSKGGMRENFRKEKEKDKQEEKDLLNEINKDDTTENRNNYIDKNIDNRKKYEEEYERIDKEEKYDIEHGKAEPVREQYKEQQEQAREQARQKEDERISKYFKDQEESALKQKDYGYGFSKETLSKMSDEDLNKYIEKNQELVNEYTGKYNQDLTYDQRKTRNRQDAVWDGGMKTKYETQLKNAQEELASRNKSTSDNEEKPKYLEQRNKEAEFEKKQGIYDGSRPQNEDGSYKYKDELKENSKSTNDSYSNLDNYEVYEKADKLANETKDYELKFKIHEQLDKIDRANRRGIGYAEKPTNELRNILRENNEKINQIDRENKINSMQNTIDKTISKARESQSTNETMNNAIREKAGKEKVYTLDDGTPIDQNYMKEVYSGRSYEDIKRQNDTEKEWLKNVKPEMRERQEAFIKETDKYLDNMEKFESRISDDFSTRERQTGYPFSQGTAWEGSKSNSNLYGKDKIKAIDDEIKKAYPGIKTSRKTAQGGYTDSFTYNIVESDKPIVRNIDDFSDTEIERLYNSGYNKNWYKTKEDFKDNLKKDLESGHFDINQYHIDNDYRLTPYGKQVFKDIMKVSNAYNYDESDSMTDYFNTGHYISIGVGKDGKPYQTTNSKMNDTIRTQANVKSAWKQYLKDHPESDMSLSEFKKKNK